MTDPDSTNANDAVDLRAPDAERESDTDREPAPPADRGEAAYRVRAWSQALVVTAVTAAVVTLAFRYEWAGPTRMLPLIGGAYLVLFLGAARFLHARGELREALAPKRLDLTMGALVAGVLYLAANLLPTALFAGRAAEGWLFRLYLQLGDPRDTAPPYVGVAVLATATLEEIVWRGWVMRALQRAHGSKVALIGTTALYALAHLGTMFVLRDPEAGMNPLVVTAALGCGLVWGAMALRFERLGPSLAAHALFSWAMALFPLWARG